MGAGQSSIEIPGGGSEGYHVLRVQPNSPGEQAGLEPFFDFIVMVGDERLDRDDDTLKDALKISVERPVKLMVFSSKTITCREVFLTPSTMWGGQGLLGVSIRFCTFDNAHENVWHILEVENNSPAQFAGLRAYTDYIIGADSISLAEQDDLFSLVEAHDGRPLKLFVYNSETDNCRDVVVTPNSAWGGDGLLGCGIGYGLLHRIPTDGKDHTSTEDKIRARNQLSQARSAGNSEVSSHVSKISKEPSQSLGYPGMTTPANNLNTGRSAQDSYLQSTALGTQNLTGMNGLPDTNMISPGLQSLANADYGGMSGLNVGGVSNPGSSSLNQPAQMSMNLPSLSNLNLSSPVTTMTTPNLSNLGLSTIPGLNLPPLNLPNLNLNTSLATSTALPTSSSAYPSTSLSGLGNFPSLTSLKLPSSLNLNSTSLNLTSPMPTLNFDTSKLPDINDLNLGSLNLNLDLNLPKIGEDGKVVTEVQ